MDYIVFGLGSGATLTLLGWAFREWGPRVRDRPSARDEVVLSGYELVDRMAWQRFCRSCGALLAIVGSLVLLATIIATALMLSNSTGATIVLSTMAVCVLATLVWVGLFLHRFGSLGIIRPKSTPPVPVFTDSLEPSGETVVASLVGPPVPAGGATLVATESPIQRDAAERDDAASDDAELSARNRLVSREKRGELADPHERRRSKPVGDTPLLAGPVLTDDDIPDGTGGDEGAVAGHDVDGATEEPSVEPPILVFAAKEDPSGILDDTDPSDVSSSDVTLTDEAGRDAPGDETAGVADPHSRRVTEAHDEQAPAADAPAGSGRADAVRQLRERRIRRRRRGSPPPE